MKKIKLQNIFESIIQNNSIEWSEMMHTVGVMGDLAKRNGGNAVIQEADFLALFGNNPPSRNIVNFIVNGDYNQNYTTKTKIGRVYNLFKYLNNLVANNGTNGFKINAAYLTQYKGAIDEIVTLCKEIKANTGQKRSSLSISQTEQLKDHLTFNDEHGSPVRVDESHFQAFIDKHDPQVNEYYHAIMNANLKLPFDNSPAGLVYQLYRAIHTQCSSTMYAYANMMNKMKALTGGKGGSSSNGVRPLVSVQALDVINTQDRTHMEIIYKLYNFNNNRMFRKETLTGYYTYYDKKWTYQFVNNRDKNNHFTFAKPIPKDFIHVGTLYNIEYNDATLATDKSKLLRIEFVEIKSGGKAQSLDYSQFGNCRALTELLDVLHHIRN